MSSYFYVFFNGNRKNRPVGFLLLLKLRGGMWKWMIAKIEARVDVGGMREDGGVWCERGWKCLG